MSPDHVKSPLGAKSPPTRTTAVSLLKLSRESPGEVSWVLFPTSKFTECTPGNSTWREWKKQDWAEGNVEQRCGFSKGVCGFLGELWDPLELSQIQARCRVLLLLLIAYGTSLTSLPSTGGGARGELSCKLYSWLWQNELSPCGSSKFSTTVPTDRREELQTFQSHGLKDWAWPPWELIAGRPQFHNHSVLSLSRAVRVQEN